MLPSVLTDTVSADLREAVDQALLWGLEGVALRTVRSGRVPDVNETLIRRVLEEAEMPVVAIDPGLFEGDASSRASSLDDLEVLASMAAFCARLGCSTIIAGPLGAAPRETSVAADVLRRAGDVVAKAGLHLAVRNEGECATAASLADLIRTVDHPHVGALWSTEASRASGETTLQSATSLSGVHLAMIEADEAFALDPPEASGISLLAQNGFGGPVVLTFTAPPHDGLKVATALIRSLRQARRSVTV